METIVLQPSNAAELLLLKEFIEKTQIKNWVLSENDGESFVLNMMKRDIDYTETVDASGFIKGLEVK